MRKFLFLLPFFLWTCGGGGGSTEPEPPQLPTVTNIEVTTLEDTAKTFALTGTDPNNLALTYSISTQPQHGTISISGGAATYSPNANYHGQDVIAFLASSTSGNSNIGTITITITSVDDEPNTMDVTATTDEDNSVTISLEAEEFDGDSIEFQVRNNPSNGTVTISGNTASYTPDENWNGTDSFNFEAIDSSARSVLNVATATITVNPVNDAPVADNMTVSTDENRLSQLDITLAASDVDNDNLTYSLASNVSNGETSLNGNTLTYTPSQDWNGEDEFTFKVNDGTVDSNIASVKIIVNSINDAPTAENIEGVEVEINQSVDIQLIGNDIEGDNLTYTIVENPSRGTIQLQGNNLSYSAVSVGIDSLKYIVNDGELDSQIAKVDIKVTTNTFNLYYGTANNDYVNDMLVDSEDLIWLYGYKSSPTSSYIVKLDRYGQVIWENIYSSPSRIKRMVETTSNTFLAVNTDRIVSMNSSGDILWDKTYNLPINGNFETIVQSSGKYFVVGTYLNSNSQRNIFIFQINGDGDVIEINNSQAIYIEEDFKIEVDYAASTDDGGVVISGSSEDSNGFGLKDSYVLKLDANLNVDWSKYYGSNSNDIFRKVIPTNDNGFIGVGTSESYDEFFSPYIVKIDSDGNQEWMTTIRPNINGTSGRLYSVLELTDGYILGGNFTIPGGDQETLVFKIDKQGNKLWEQFYDLGQYERLRSQLYSYDDGIIFGGDANSSDNTRGTDFTILKFDISGNRIF